MVKRQMSRTFLVVLMVAAAAACRNEPGRTAAAVQLRLRLRSRLRLRLRARLRLGLLPPRLRLHRRHLLRGPVRGGASKAHQCWRDADCSGGKTCHGAALCPCGAACRRATQGPGVCVVETPPCTAVEEGWVEEISRRRLPDALDGHRVRRDLLPGCCGTQGFDDLVFPDSAACEAACLP